MYQRLNKAQLKTVFHLSGDDPWESLEYSAYNGQSGYALFFKEKKLYEVIGNVWEPKETSIMKMIKKMSIDSDVQKLYMEMPGFMALLKEVQKTTSVVVDLLIKECKGFSPSELREWMNGRTVDELEELKNFGKIVAKFSGEELDERLYDGEYDDYEEDEEDGD